MRPSKVRDQKKTTLRRSGVPTRHARPEKITKNSGTKLVWKNARPNNTYFGVQGWPLNMRNPKTTFWRSGAATENARPEKKTRQGARDHWPLPKKMRDQKKNSLAFKGGHWTRPTRKLNNELRKHLLQQMRDQKKNTPPFRGGRRTSEIRTKTLPPSQTAAERPQSQDDLPGVWGGHRNCATRKKSFRHWVPTIEHAQQKSNSVFRSCQRKMRE